MFTRRVVIAGVAGFLVLLSGGRGVHAQNIESPVQVIEGLEPVELGYGDQTVGAEINTIGDFDRYQFFAEAGDVVDLNLANLGSQEMWIQVRDPEGAIVVTNYWALSGGDFRTRSTIAKRGQHSVLVQENTSDETGPYILQIERMPPLFSRPDLRRLYYGAGSFEDEISPHCDTDWFFFHGVQDTQVNLLLNVLDSWEAHFEIWSNDGVRVYLNYWDLSGGDFNNTFTVPATADYYVAVSERNFDESGRFNLNLQCISGPCPPIDEAVYQIVDAGPNCVDVRLINNVPVRGGELSIGYPSSVVSNVIVTALRPGMPDDIADNEVVTATGLSLAGCQDVAGVDRGLTINWLDRNAGVALMQPGRREILRLCFTPAAGSTNATCPDFKLLSCLGPAGNPVQNLVTHQLGGTVVAQTVDARTCCTVNTTFRRGDVNGDKSYDVSDSIAILICQFLNVGCTRCPVASDANDDGKQDITDAIHLLNWRFLNGPQPPAPFPGCGLDPTAPSNELCIEPAC